MKKLSIEEIKQRLKETHGDVVTMDELTYTNIRTKCRFIDKNYGEFYAVPDNVIRKKATHAKRKLEKISLTNLNKYGVNCIFELDTIKEKCNKSHKISLNRIKDKLFKIHGDTVILDESTYVDTHTKCRFVDKDYGEWWAIPYNVFKGSGNPLRARVLRSKKITLSVEQIKNRLFKKFENRILLDELTYINYREKCKFIDKIYGEFWARPYNVLLGKHNHPSQKMENFKQTSLNRYGAENPMHNKEIVAKSCRNQSTSIILYHWQTGEELICTASYEQKSVQYLNENKINYKWKPQGFKLPNGKMYYPDLYLTDTDTWVEIKGYFRKDAKEKWDLFCKEHPNSELWDTKKLKELKII